MRKNLKTKEWIDSYVEWLKNNYEITSLENGDEITTPFTNTIGDNIRLYIQKKGRNIELSDDGNTINDLDLMGVNIESDTRKELLKKIFRQYEVHRNKDILMVESSVQDFPIKKQRLLQAILRVDDLFMTKQSVVTNIFLQEVLDFFNKNDFGGLPSYTLEGKTGNSYKYDYALGSTSNRPLTLFQVMNNPSFQKLAIEAYALSDVQKKKTSNPPKIVVVYSSSNKISQKSKNVAKDSGIETVSWAQKDKLKNYI